MIEEMDTTAQGYAAIKAFGYELKTTSLKFMGDLIDEKMPADLILSCIVTAYMNVLMHLCEGYGATFLENDQAGQRVFRNFLEQALSSDDGIAH